MSFPRFGVVLLVLTAASACRADAAPRFALEAGPSYTFLLYDEELDLWKNGGRTTWSAAAHLEWPLSSSVGLQTGPGYVNYGNHVELGDPDIEGQFEITQSYVVLPVSITVHPGATRRWYVAGGPEAGWLASARTESEYQFLGVRFQNVDKDERDGMAKWILIGAAEAGTEIRIGRQGARVGLRYTRSITRATRKGAWLSDWTLQSVEAVFGLVW